MSGSAAETKGKSASRTNVVVDTKERRESRREDKADAEGVAEVDRRRVGESRIRWIFRVGWVDERDLILSLRALWVEAIEASFRKVVFEAWAAGVCVGCWTCCGCACGCEGTGAGGPREGMGPRFGSGPPRLGNGEAGVFLTGSVLCAVGGAIGEDAVAVFEVATGNRCVNPSTKTNLSC